MSHLPKNLYLILLSAALFTGCVHKKYETPIAKNTQQPDKVLFDSAMNDIEHGRYEVARISLQTLMNTYDSSEYMAKAKLAIADSWFREGGVNGLSQAEAEYKDFILFYPQMEESAQAQNRVCDIHYKQMDKSDRDQIQTLLAENECKALIVQFPNSKFVPEAQQKLRNIQESLAEHEFKVGDFYYSRQMNPAAANRLNALVDQYPLYSKAGDALYEAGDSYSKMGPRFRTRAGEMFARIVREYPGSDKVKEATARLEDMEMPVPQPDQAALDRAKWEKANYKAPSMLSKSVGILGGGPDITHAARSGAPTMTDPKRTFPASIPVPVQTTESANGTNSAGGTTDVTVSNAGSGALDTKQDARTETGASGTAASSTTPPAATGPLPTNRDADLKRLREQQAKKQAKLDKKRKKNSDTSGNNGPSSNTSSTPVTNSTTPPQVTTPPQSSPTNPPQQ